MEFLGFDNEDYYDLLSNEESDDELIDDYEGKFDEEYPDGGLEKIKANKVDAGRRNRTRRGDSYKRARRNAERFKDKV